MTKPEQVQNLVLRGSESSCCRAPSLIVRSRERGFVTQNCETCGKPRWVSLSELPDLSCGRCRKTLARNTNRFKNYVYFCPDCRSEWQISDLVPRWDERFDYYGFGLDSDVHNRRQLFEP